MPSEMCYKPPADGYQVADTSILAVALLNCVATWFVVDEGDDHRSRMVFDVEQGQELGQDFKEVYIGLP